MVKVRAAGAVALFLVLGCFATLPTQPSKPVVEFPSQARLAAVEAKPATLPSIQAGEVPPEGWTVPGQEPPPEATGAPVQQVSEQWSPQGAWEETFAAAYATSGRKAALTRAMSCAAAEIGRFYLEKDAVPPESLQRFVTAACGVYAPAVGYNSLKGTLPAAAPDDKLIAKWKDQVGAGMVGRVPVSAKHAGFWFGRRGSRAVALVAFESTPVDLTPFKPVPDFNGDLAIVGQLEGDAAYFAGYINQGRFGVQRCLVDPSVARPRFRISCRMAPADDTAWIQIVYAAPRSVLTLPIVQVLARRDARKPLVYAETPYVRSKPATDDAVAFAPAVIAGLNATRVEAGLAPVRLAEAQSATASRVARQYFAAALGATGVGDLGPGALDDMNTIALGLLAGWQVTGTIRDGTFYSGILPHARDAGRWVDSALALPMGRQAMMAPEIDEVALGSAMFDAPKGVGAVACGYRFHRSNDHTADINHLLDRIASGRRNMNLPPPTRLTGMDAVLQRELARVQQGALTPFTALQASLEEAAGRYRADMKGIVVETTSLDALELPRHIMARPDLQLEIGVTHYKPPGAAWAQMVIVVVYASAGGVEI
jgi:hypothetical protein